MLCSRNTHLLVRSLFVSSFFPFVLCLLLLSLGIKAEASVFVNLFNYLLHVSELYTRYLQQQLYYYYQTLKTQNYYL